VTVVFAELTAFSVDARVIRRANRHRSGLDPKTFNFALEL
jgi:hypothetical protein